MPWCTTCDRFLNPGTVRPDGTCPTCGRAVDPGHAHGADPEAAASARPVPAASATAGTPDDELRPVPWHLKVLAGGVALYLLFRLWQGVEWFLHR